MASPQLQDELGLSAAWLSTALFTVPLLIAVVAEPWLLVRAQRWDRRRALGISLAAMSIAEVGVAAAHTPLALSAAVSLWGIAGSLAVAFGEIALVSRAEDTHRAMARWALAGSLGDLLAPLCFAGAVALGLDWRVALMVGAAIGLLDAAVVWTGPPLAADDEDDEPPARLRDALGNRAVLRWVVAATACTLFDEILVSFGGLWLHARGATESQQGFAFAGVSLGAALSQVAVERLLPRFGPRRILVGSAAALLVAWPIWLWLPCGYEVLTAGIIGALVAPMWALCTAEAYAQGERPELVAALTGPFGAVDVALPLLLGLVADRYGLGAALLLLLLQPAVVGWAAATPSRPRWNIPKP